jgi:hypothetical protein
VKEGLQEVKEILLPPRKHPSVSERHLCPQAIHKKAIKPNPPHPWDHHFQILLHSPVCCLSLLFANKIFLTSAVGVCFFILRAGLGTLST